ncbi:hypothetical protein F5884DRAFT_744846 [Xylogone sp. PMI_703]|nr:hypothetical protein F5884DRAFT_744846 [Xylogone sp. PMI_703]
MFSTLILLIILQIQVAFANTEKAIFLGPQSLDVPLSHPMLDDLHLNALSPLHWAIRTYIDAQFPTAALKRGQASWFLLRDLEEGRRYEVRICWAATQPTNFWLYTYDIPAVFENPDLISSLAEYSESRQPIGDLAEDETPKLPTPIKWHRPEQDFDTQSTLFLQIFAAADYYTTNTTLMDNVPPVFVDIILDPYLFNIFPRSLLSTGAYIGLLAIGGWILSGYISRWLRKIAHNDAKQTKKHA